MQDDFHQCVLPPKDEEWQMGQTAASVKFVRDAEKYMKTCSDEEKALLERAIADIKDHKLVLQDWLAPEEYLKQNK